MTCQSPTPSSTMNDVAVHTEMLVMDMDVRLCCLLRWHQVQLQSSFEPETPTKKNPASGAAQRTPEAIAIAHRVHKQVVRAPPPHDVSSGVVSFRSCARIYLHRFAGLPDACCLVHFPSDCTWCRLLHPRRQWLRCQRGRNCGVTMAGKQTMILSTRIEHFNSMTLHQCLR